MRRSGQSAQLLLVVLVLASLVSVSHGVSYSVGGPLNNMWEFPKETWTYDKDWTKGKKFQKGDQLTFNYTSGLHNVLELVSEDDYNSCNLDAIVTGGQYSSGYDLIKLETEGGHYFVCGILNHCALRNLKVKVFVGDVPTAGGNASTNLTPIIGAVVAAVVVLALVAVGIWFFRRRRRRRARKASYEHGREDSREHQSRSNGSARKNPLVNMGNMGMDGPRVFTVKEIAAATKNFSRSELLGRGGFGSVYKGTLKDKSIVAVKSIAEDSRQGESEFLSEVSIIGKIRHRNLVRLRGWCVEKEKLMVVYDYMSNGSLDKWIIPTGKEEESTPVLGWDPRYNILTGIAAAMAYLHEEWQQCILHRDVKPSNVLLDENFNAYLGDFGMARLIDHNKMAYSTVVAGTMGYLAPELPHTRKATPKTDVFSFGVLALEVTCGRRAFDPNLPHAEVYLLDWVWTMHQNGDLKKCVDARLGDDFDLMQTRLTLHLGLLACHPDPASRPSMRFIRQVLNGDLSLPTMPPSRPVISYSWSSNMASTQECISIDVSQHSENTESVSSAKYPDKSPSTVPPLPVMFETSAPSLSPPRRFRN